MADRATIARPYARAAFAHAQAHTDLPGWSKLLGSAAAVATDSRVARLIGNPHVTGDELVEMLVEIAGGAGGAEGRNFLRAVAQNRRLALLPVIASQFETLRAEVENVIDVEIVAAREIAAPQQKRLAEALKCRFGREVRLHTRIDESLIGGAIVRAGDLVIDGSLKDRLARLASALTN
ncbi:MAG: F0F1 ATP synthase subunit delta [Gammaproteobacteria bacterium]|nr:F0F1 ATP synthase subunit delta [Gammaproteobacteria bacterium]